MTNCAFLTTAAAALALAGCSFGGKVPDKLLTLSATQPPAASAGAPVSGNAVIVAAPSLPEMLRNNRIPVQSSETEVAYLKDAQWVSNPDRLFRQVLADVITARTGRPTFDPLSTSAEASARLGGRLSQFGLDARTMEAVASYDAVLARGGATETRRFETRIPVGAAERNIVAPALNQAANQIAGEVADWVGAR